MWHFMTRKLQWHASFTPAAAANLADGAHSEVFTKILNRHEEDASTAAFGVLQPMPEFRSPQFAAVRPSTAPGIFRMRIPYLE
mmetsp:Transcript_42680/g.80090  ORF Transcript_42680/g.80090 Transcript_42680/m.80090 type:complete len:83 (+) Transcript_42680:966-1214(+)